MMVPAVGKQGKGRSLGWKEVPRVAIGGAALTVGNEGDGRQRHRQSLRGALEQYLQRSHLQAAATIERRRNAQIWREERSIRIVIPGSANSSRDRRDRGRISTGCRTARSGQTRCSPGRPSFRVRRCARRRPRRGTLCRAGPRRSKGAAAVAQAAMGDGT
ncbi:hypothetical protein B296_00044302 [Ensete ventricosum]|uniref:Uncharacterized protein n=1 Tax=Ensete ventricosum TaxID=4639 RepID=A0A426YTA3_ENSVE|nr:hypothetical protein B296_00044302 [Ensete ventricosum]